MNNTLDALVSLRTELQDNIDQFLLSEEQEMDIIDEERLKRLLVECLFYLSD